MLIQPFALARHVYSFAKFYRSRPQIGYTRCRNVFIEDSLRKKLFFSRRFQPAFNKRKSSIFGQLFLSLQLKLKVSSVSVNLILGVIWPRLNRVLSTALSSVKPLLLRTFN